MPRRKLQIFPEGTIVCQKYTVEEPLVYGAFSCTYSATDNRGKSVALKLIPLRYHQEVASEQVSLAKLHKWHIRFRNLRGGFPRLRMVGVHSANFVKVMEPVGLSIGEYFKCKQNHWEKTVLMIGIRMIRILKHMHSRRVIHRNIKPDNIVVGAGSRGMKKLYLVDFDISLRLPRDELQNGGIRVAIRGTRLFMSTRTLNGESPTRMDDLESLGYTLWFLYGGILPWDSRYISEFPSCEVERYLLTYDLRNRFLRKVDCDGIKWLEDMFNIIFDTEYDEIPDYVRLEKVLRKELRSQGYRLDYQFDLMLPDNFLNT
ncbi:Protein kinase [Gracilaria domingensis]|nr:Protein kinase [Gracilaria domingensis]